MINWIKYDPANPPEESKSLLVIDEHKAFWIAQFYGRQWNHDIDIAEPIVGVTHYAHINLPGEDKADGI